MRVKFQVLLTGGLLVLLSLPQTSRGAQEAYPSVKQLMNTLMGVHIYYEVAISPNGRNVAWVERQQATSGASLPTYQIFVKDLDSDGDRPRRISAASSGNEASEHDISWSPDSTKLAFLSDAVKKGQSNVYVADVKGDQVTKLTQLDGFPAQPRWSPTGETVAFLFTENQSRDTGPLQPHAKEVGLIESQISEQRLATVEVKSKNFKFVSPADLYIYEYDWAPDTSKFVTTAAHGSGDDNWYIAELCVVPVIGGECTPIFKPSFQIANPRWSPDGKTIAFIGGLMSDQGGVGGDIYAVPATGGPARDLTPDMKASAGWIGWLPSSKQLLFHEFVQGSAGFGKLDLSTGVSTILWTGPEWVTSMLGLGVNISLTHDGQSVAVVRNSYEKPPEVWAGPIGDWKQITHGNESLRPAWGETRDLRWESDGQSIQGWLLCPRDYQSDRKYPLIVFPHGGPSADYLPMWPMAYTYYLRAVLAAEGYFVLLPNPRGSYGQGENFVRANVKDFGHGDLRDILAGVDQASKEFPIDENRMGISGWSYGGYMTMWSVTQTHRFRAAVAGAGVSDWQSYYGENDIDQWMIPFFGTSVYDDPAVYAKSSPIVFVKNVNTPTLIVVGDSDGESPTSQSYEFWHALKTLGVPTQMVIYPNEGHWIMQPTNVLDYVERSIRWFDEHLK